MARVKFYRIRLKNSVPYKRLYKRHHSNGGQGVWRTRRSERADYRRRDFSKHSFQFQVARDVFQSPEIRNPALDPMAWFYAPAGCAPTGGGVVSLGFSLMFKAQVAAIIAIRPPAKKATS